jgi:hypothetical protein
MHTRVQLASASMGSEWSARPTRRFHCTKTHITSIDRTDMMTPQKVVTGFVPNIDIIQTCHHQTDNQNVKGGTGDSQSIALEGIPIARGILTDACYHVNNAKAGNHLDKNCLPQNQTRPDFRLQTPARWL